MRIALSPLRIFLFLFFIWIFAWFVSWIQNFTWCLCVSVSMLREFHFSRWLFRFSGWIKWQFSAHANTHTLTQEKKKKTQKKYAKEITPKTQNTTIILLYWMHASKCVVCSSLVIVCLNRSVLCQQPVDKPSHRRRTFCPCWRWPNALVSQLNHKCY